jgi:serine/threonine protein kinase
LVVHGDLKPGNILVTTAGVPKLLDFGIARLLDPAQLTSLTRAELWPMTPAYASPEQVRGEVITTASDIYSLGALLHTLLTGHLPKISDSDHPHGVASRKALPSISNVMSRRVDELTHPEDPKTRPAPELVSQSRSNGVREVHKRLAGDLNSIILMAMNKTPYLRYSSVGQFADDIGRYLLGLPVLAHKNTVGYRFAKFIGRHKIKATIACMLLLILVALFISQWLHHGSRS